MLCLSKGVNLKQSRVNVWAGNHASSGPIKYI